MAYFLEVGQYEDDLVQKSFKMFGKIPKRIRDAPRIWEGLDLFWEAFAVLSSCRPMGMSVGPIPWTSVQEYCDRKEIQGELRDDVWYHVRALDNVYLKHVAKQHGKSK